MFIGVISIFSYKFISKEYKEEINKKYEDEIKNMSKEDLKVVNEVISLAKDREGQEYTWGGKGEIVTKERLKELIDCYGESYYPLDKKDYIGIQGFDCSGLTYWTYKEVSGVNIGYSTSQQQEVLKKYKVKDTLQPGDLIFTTRHVVLYIGDGYVIHSKNKYKYPTGGIKKDSVKWYKKGTAYRVIDYINDQK